MAPMGIWDSVILRPTLDHFATGSRLTPLLIKACRGEQWQAVAEESSKKREVDEKACHIARVIYMEPTATKLLLLLLLVLLRSTASMDECAATPDLYTILFNTKPTRHDVMSNDGVEIGRGSHRPCTAVTALGDGEGSRNNNKIHLARTRMVASFCKTI